MRFHCAPAAAQRKLVKGTVPIVLYDQPSRSRDGSVGTSIINRCRQLGLVPSDRAWDFLSIALSVVAADGMCYRRESADGWTRELELEIAVRDTVFWSQQIKSLQRFLGFLTGDIWYLKLIDGGIIPPPPQKQHARPEEAITLLSGGLDSLIGTLDRTAEGVSIVSVSQVSIGEGVQQRNFSQRIGGGLFHVQLNHNSRPTGERSQRSRSIVFFAFGILAATALNKYRAGQEVILYVPENGFISLNIPLTQARLGSLSTRTTHPFYMKQLQTVLEASGLRVKLVNPYQFMTKGEMLTQCKDQTGLRRLANNSISCGRFRRNGFRHCGRCLPCLIRRAAFRRWGRRDNTNYVYEDLSITDSSHRNFIDVRAAGIAVEYARRFGVNRWVGAALNTAQLGDTTPHFATAARGLEELSTFLSSARAL